MNWGKNFPYGNNGHKPVYIVCNDCTGDGWGPMLTTETWDTIVSREENHCRFFLCQSCIERRLGREIESNDLRDCPMNVSHPRYFKHGRL